MPRGGPRPGSGRPKGAINRLSAAAIAAAQASGDLPHQFLLRVSRGETIKTGKGKKAQAYTPTFQDRMTAAGMAAPYYAPKLAATEHSGPGGGPIEHAIAGARSTLEGKLAGLAARDGAAKVPGEPE